MTDPSALANTSTSLSAGGSGLSAVGAIFSGMSQSRMYQYQAGLAQINKQIALQNADYALQTGETQSVEYGLKASQRAGAIRAAQGASGLDVGGGSATDVRASQHMITEMDLGTIRKNAARVAYGYQTEAATDDAQSNLYGMAATNARNAGFVKAAGSLVSGAGSVSDKWLQMGQFGLNGGRSGSLGGVGFDPDRPASLY